MQYVVQGWTKINMSFKNIELFPTIFGALPTKKERLTAEIGFQPVLLQGGYKAYRKHIGQYLCGEDGPGPKETLLEKLKFIRNSHIIIYNEKR